MSITAQRKHKHQQQDLLNNVFVCECERNRECLEKMAGWKRQIKYHHLLELHIVPDSVPLADNHTASPNTHAQCHYSVTPPIYDYGNRRGYWMKPS